LKPIEVGNCTIIEWRYNNQRGSYVAEEHQRIKAINICRAKLPHGWLCSFGDGTTFVPFGDNGTGWGKGDDAKLRLDGAEVLNFG
jgi:hypothetical protein